MEGGQTRWKIHKSWFGHALAWLTKGTRTSFSLNFKWSNLPSEIWGLTQNLWKFVNRECILKTQRKISGWRCFQHQMSTVVPERFQVGGVSNIRVQLYQKDFRLEVYPTSRYSCTKTCSYGASPRITGREVLERSVLCHCLSIQNISYVYYTIISIHFLTMYYVMVWYGMVLFLFRR